MEVKTKLDDLEKKVNLISTKGLTADLINKYNFFLDGLQNYLVLYRLDVFIGLMKMVAIEKLNYGGLQECHKKVLKIGILQTLFLLPN